MICLIRPMTGGGRVGSPVAFSLIAMHAPPHADWMPHWLQLPADGAEPTNDAQPRLADDRLAAM